MKVGRRSVFLVGASGQINQQEVNQLKFREIKIPSVLAQDLWRNQILFQIHLQLNRDLKVRVVTAITQIGIMDFLVAT